jgi:hypothetical protein
MPAAAEPAEKRRAHALRNRFVVVVDETVALTEKESVS